MMPNDPRLVNTALVMVRANWGLRLNIVRLVNENADDGTCWVSVSQRRLAQFLRCHYRYAYGLTRDLVDRRVLETRPGVGTRPSWYRVRDPAGWRAVPWLVEPEPGDGDKAPELVRLRLLETAAQNPRLVTRSASASLEPLVTRSNASLAPPKLALVTRSNASLAIASDAFQSASLAPRSGAAHPAGATSPLRNRDLKPLKPLVVVEGEAPKTERPPTLRQLDGAARVVADEIIKRRPLGTLAAGVLTARLRSTFEGVPVDRLRVVLHRIATADPQMGIPMVVDLACNLADAGALEPSPAVPQAARPRWELDEEGNAYLPDPGADCPDVGTPVTEWKSTQANGKAQ